MDALQGFEMEQEIFYTSEGSVADATYTSPSAFWILYKAKYRRLFLGTFFFDDRNKKIMRRIHHPPTSS